MNFRNIKGINSLIGLTIAAIVLLVLSVAVVYTKEIDVQSAQEQAIIDNDLALQAVVEVRRSSDDATTAFKLYVITGDKKYEGYAKEILDILTGQTARPVDYGSPYWDFVFATGKKPRADTNNSVSLRQIAEQANMTDNELALLDAALGISSTQLSSLELEASNAIKGIFRDANGDFGRIGIPDQDLAKNLMFGDGYNKAKANFSEPASQLNVAVENRTEQVLSAFDEELSVYNNYIVGLVVALIASIIVLAYFVWRKGGFELEERQAAQERAEHVNEQMNDSVINILQAVSLLSEKDLTVRAPVTEDVIGTVSDSINLLADETANVLKGVSHIAGQVSIVSSELHLKSDQVSKTAELERQSVQHMIETLFDATQTMNQVAALAELSGDSAEQATQVTEQALQTVNKTVDGMENIRETISETEKRIKRLGERSQEISGIVNLINTISERTHVLALNASMQAAVAGEAGRGFAVVAAEVQQLAESSRNATEQIATLVNNIQIETNETINTVNRTIGQVVEGSEQAQQAGKQMRETQSITAELVGRVKDIAKSSVQQKEMSADLLEAAQAIGDGVEKTAQQIEEQKQGTEELQLAAQSLVDSVGVFKLPE